MSSDELSSDPAISAGTTGDRKASVAPPISPMPTLERTDTVRTIGWMKLRGRRDDLPQQWWFASTAIPLMSATIGPFSNVLSVAALVTTWRVTLPNNGELPEGIDTNGTGITDPRWEIILNVISLACGFAGNFFLLLNFTGRVRYIVSLPLSIVFWILASAILISITTAMHVYAAPVGPGEIYSQGYWHAVMASILYAVGSVMLVVNMLGYFLGHYPQEFHLDDDQRTLILQTLSFFFWLAGGAGIFSRIEGWTYTDALYYADVSILTIGFGDIYPTSDAGRGFLFVYELVGIIFLGLVISSISRFAGNISADKIIKTHQKHARESTVGRTVTNEVELRERLGLPPRRPSADKTVAGRRESLNQYGRLEISGRTVTFHERKAPVQGGGRGGAARTKALSRDEKIRLRSESNDPAEKRRQRRQKLLLLQEEKDRFDAMREIQDETRRFKQYYSVCMAFLAFGVLWGIGALIFMFSEARVLNLTYFEALYFCFVALLTIGYGDFSPKSNAGRSFFIVWSLIAVPTMTIFIQEMSSTVVSAVNRGTFKLADWTVLPKKGIFKAFLDEHVWLREQLSRFSERRQERRRIKQGFQLQSPDEDLTRAALEGDAQRETTLDELDLVDSDHDLARQLAVAIKGVAQDLRASPPKRYPYEQWVYFTKLIRFSKRSREEVELLEEEEGLVEWDWIGEDSPMLADITEAEWVLNRLCESLNRYTRKQARAAHGHHSRQHSKTHDTKPHPETIEETEVKAADQSSDAVIAPAIRPPPTDPGPSGQDDEAEVVKWSERLKHMSSKHQGAEGTQGSAASNSHSQTKGSLYE